MLNKASSSLSRKLSAAPPEAVAAILTIEGARASQNQAMAARRSARDDRLRSMKRAASKLREMAAKTAMSAFYQGALSALQTIVSTGAHFSAGKDALILKAIASGYGAMKAVDPAAISRAHDEAEKKELEIEADQASDAVEDANGDLANARRLASSATSLLKSMLEARQAAEMAALRA